MVDLRSIFDLVSGLFVVLSIYYEGPTRQRQREVQITPQLKQLLSQGSGVLDFTIDVNCIAPTPGFRWNEHGADMMAIASKILFEDVEQGELPSTWMHEIGHRLGMVAYGNKDHRLRNRNFIHRPWLPDAPTTLYGESPGINDQRHQGPHCKTGAIFNTSTGAWTGAPKCVMFGAVATDNGNKPPNSYCPKCTPVVQKLDLSKPPEDDPR